MFWLVIAIFCSAGISLMLRLADQFKTEEINVFLVNYLVCALLALLFIKERMESFSTILFGVVTGFFFLASLVYLKKNMKESGVVLASTFMKLGVLVPTFFAIFVFKEKLTLFRILGVFFVIVAIILMNKGQKEEKFHLGHLIILLLLAGFGDALANIFQRLGNYHDQNYYLFITFFSAFILTLFLKKKRLTIVEVGFGFIVGFFNYFSSKFLLKALSLVESIIVYPVYSISTLLLITLVGVFFFHEQLKKHKLMGLVIIIFALCLLNI